ncbi:MAG: DoxX family membrane protein [Calditrichaeota bacterium]|nr:MAG: DoxX family membrane protein [Calditrichota bacterium]
MKRSSLYYLEWILRLIFGVTLIYASIDKIIHPHQFATTVENYQLVGPYLSRLIAVWLPYLELLTGLLLIVGIWLEASALTNMLLMTIFLIAVSQAYLRGLDIHCGCFSTEGESNITPLKLLYNLFLFSGSVFLFYLIRKRAK